MTDTPFELILRALAAASMNPDQPLPIRAALWKLYSILHAQRSPVAVRRMEQTKGLR